nr:MAG TPA: hypothetical protein [Bacteriophage sp.]
MLPVFTGGCGIFLNLLVTSYCELLRVTNIHTIYTQYTHI